MRGAFGLSLGEDGTPPTPNALSEVDGGDTVIRLVPLMDAYIPKDAKLPTSKAFEPSTADLEEARTLGRPVAITVWNARLTTVSEARTLMRSERERAAFGLRVGDVQDIARTDPERRLRVVATPIVPSEGPGSDGHCGIEGCDRPPGRARLEHKAILDRLAEKCSPVTG